MDNSKRWLFSGFELWVEWNEHVWGPNLLGLFWVFLKIWIPLLSLWVYSTETALKGRSFTYISFGTRQRKKKLFVLNCLGNLFFYHNSYASRTPSLQSKNSSIHFYNIAAEIFKAGRVRTGSGLHVSRFQPRGKLLCELTTLLWAISWRMLGVTRLQNSSAVRIAVKLNSFWFWTFVATALCSQYTVQSWAKINAWKREHMCSTEVWGGRRGRAVTSHVGGAAPGSPPPATLAFQGASCSSLHQRRRLSVQNKPTHPLAL